MAEQSIWQTPTHGAAAPPSLRWASAATPSSSFHPARSAIHWSPALQSRPLPAGAVPGVAPWLMDTSSAEALPLHPADPRYWTRQGGGNAILKGIALAHVALGLLGVVLGMLAWYLLQPGALLPVIVSGTALLATLAGAVALELSRFTHPGSAVAARVLLVSADLILAACLLWLLGGDSLAPTLFLIPNVVAALFFSMRRALLAAAVAVASFILICVGQAAFGFAEWLPSNAGPAIWLPRAIALAVVAVLLVYCCGLRAEQTASGFTLMLQRIELLSNQRAALRGDQQRLIEAIHQLEESQASLTQERTTISRQMLELTDIAQRLASGDLDAIHALNPGRYGALNSLASALSQLTDQPATRGDQRPPSADQHTNAAELAPGAAPADAPASFSPREPYGVSNHGVSNPSATPSFPRLVVGQRLEPLLISANRPDGLI